MQSNTTAIFFSHTLAQPVQNLPGPTIRSPDQHQSFLLVVFIRWVACDHGITSLKIDYSLCRKTKTTQQSPITWNHSTHLHGRHTGLLRDFEGRCHIKKGSRQHHFYRPLSNRKKARPKNNQTTLTLTTKTKKRSGAFNPAHLTPTSQKGAKQTSSFSR